MSDAPPPLEQTKVYGKDEKSGDVPIDSLPVTRAEFRELRAEMREQKRAHEALVSRVAALEAKHGDHLTAHDELLDKHDDRLNDHDLRVSTTEAALLDLRHSYLAIQTDVQRLWNEQTLVINPMATAVNQCNEKLASVDKALVNIVTLLQGARR